MHVNIEYIRKVRIDNGHKQSTVADMLGISQSHYSKLEKGEVDFSIQLLSKIIDRLRLNPSEVINFSEQQKGYMKKAMVYDNNTCRCESALRNLIQEEIKKICGKCNDRK